MMAKRPRDVAYGVGPPYERLVKSIQSLPDNDTSNLFMRDMKAAWSQKKYRDGLKSKSASINNFVLSNDTKRQLKYLADSNGRTFNEAIEVLVRYAYADSKEETETHKKEKAKLVSQLDAAKKEISSLKDSLSQYVGKDVQIFHKLQVNELTVKLLGLEAENLHLSNQLVDLSKQIDGFADPGLIAGDTKVQVVDNEKGASQEIVAKPGSGQTETTGPAIDDPSLRP